MDDISQAIDGLIEALAHAVAKKINLALYTMKTEGKGVEAAINKGSPSTKKQQKSVAKQKMSDERMRCVFRDSSGHRCKERSRGPRFHYLCEKHKGTKVQSKPRR